MLQKVKLGWLSENIHEWANESNQFAHPRCAYIDSEGLFQLVKMEMSEQFGMSIWSKHVSSQMSVLCGDNRQPEEIFYIDPLPSSGEGIAAAPTPSDDAPAQSLEDVAGDLLARTTQHLQWDDTPLLKGESWYLEFEEERATRGAIPQWVDDDIQAGIPDDIEQQMWDTARFLQEVVLREDTLAEIAMETAQILASLDDSSAHDASHEGRMIRDGIVFDDVESALKAELKKAKEEIARLKRNESRLTLLVRDLSNDLVEATVGNEISRTDEGRRLVAELLAADEQAVA